MRQSQSHTLDIHRVMVRQSLPIMWEMRGVGKDACITPLPRVVYNDNNCSAPPQLPNRDELAQEWEAFQNSRVGRCHWKKKKVLLSELFDGSKEYKNCGIKVGEVTLKWPVIVGNQHPGTPGKRRLVSPTRVSRPRYGRGGFRDKEALTAPRVREGHGGVM